MAEYTPEKFPEITIVFDFYPGEQPTFDDPGCDDEVQITDFIENGEAVSQTVFEALDDYYGEKWIKEIIQNKDKVAA